MVGRNFNIVRDEGSKRHLEKEPCPSRVDRKGLLNADGKSDMNSWKLSPGNAGIVGSQRRTLFASNANTAQPRL